jgi:HlyD family secretion protein
MKRIVNKKKLMVIGISLLCIIAIAVSLIVVFVGKNDTTTEVKQQTYTVATGNIVTEISAAGNLALSTIKDLTFDLFYSKGTVGSINVSVGDTVTAGEVLAGIDSTEWSDAIQTVQDSFTAANRDTATKQRSLATAQRNVLTKQSAIASAQRNVLTSEMAVTQAQLDVTSANNTLNDIADVKAIQDEIDIDNFVIQYGALELKSTFQIGGSMYVYWATQIQAAKTELAQNKADLAALLGGTTTTTSADVALQIAQDVLALQKKQFALETAQLAVTDANNAVTNAQQDLVFAQQDVVNAQLDLDIANQKAAAVQKSLDEAKAASSEIIAPFDGIVTKINVAGGDEVLNGTVVVQIADPDKFEVNMSVSEEDISNIQLDGKAYITVDALDITLPAAVTYIAPTATISSGVVNYSVTVEVESIADYAAELAKSFNDNRTAPSGFADTGNMTMPSFSGNGTMPQMSGQTLAASLENIKVKAGMTVTAELIISEADDVLLVPYTSVTIQGPQKYVQVLKDDGTTEKRTITTGITDYTNYEVSSGLTVGEKIVLPSSSTSTSTTSTTTPTQQNSNIMFPGMGGGTPPSGGGAPPGGG